MKIVFAFVLASLVSMSAFATESQVLVTCQIKDSLSHALISLDEKGVYTLSTDITGEYSEMMATQNFEVSSVKGGKQVDIIMNGYHGHNGMILTLLLNENSFAKGTGKVSFINSMADEQQVYFNLENCSGKFKTAN